MERETLKEADVGTETKREVMTEIGKAVMSHIGKKKDLELIVTSLLIVEQVKTGEMINLKVRNVLMIKKKVGTETVIEKRKKTGIGTTKTEVETTVIKLKVNDKTMLFHLFLGCAIVFYQLSVFSRHKLF